MSAEAIPAALRDRPQWVCWRYEQRDGKRTKVPYCVDTGERASSTDPRTWATLARAVAFARKPGVDGIGYVFAAGDPFVGVDLDDCVAGGELHPQARAILDRLGTYSERSVSGNGVHAIGRAGLNGFPRNRRGGMPWGAGIEVYDQGRFFVVAGDRLPGPEEPADCQQALEALLGELFPAPSPNGQPAATVPGGRTDAEVLERAFAAANGPKLEALYRGDRGGYASHSEADLALCSLLAFWTGPDAEQLDRLFRGSALMREKWDREDYRQRTIQQALEGRADYRPRGADAPRPRTGASENGDRPGEPFALDLDAFIAARSELPPALIGDDEDVLLPAAGMIILGGKGGKGKTTLMVDAIFHLASGRPWLGFNVPRPLRVLVIENEGPREMFRRKLEAKRQSWPHQIDGRICVFTLDWGGLDLRDQDKRRRLQTFVRENEIDVVFGDPLDSCGLEGVGSPEDTRNFMALAKDVGLHQTVAFWFLHHPRKEKTDDELEELSGAWSGRPDTVLMLSLLAGERSRLALPKVRWGRSAKRPALILGFDADTEGFELVAEEGEERDYAAAIEELLTDGQWRTVREIAAPADGDPAGVGASQANVREALEADPERFASKAGSEVGRSPRATVWGLAP